MATKQFNFKNAVAGTSSHGSLQDGGSVTAATTGTGWVVAKLASGRFALMQFGTERASGSFNTTSPLGSASGPGTDDCWRSENTLNGTFANTNWVMAFKVRAVSAASSQAGRVRVRLWRSANQDGSSATELTSGAVVGTTTAALSTSADATSTVTWTPGATKTLTNEYLFVQTEWEITTASGNNSGDVDFRVDSANAFITTPDFAAIGAGDLAISGATAVAAVGASTNAATFAAAGSTAAAFTGSGVSISVTFSQSDVIVPYRRALLYRSIFEVPTVPGATASGALSVTGATAAAFVGAATAEAVLSTAGATTAAFVSQAQAAATVTFSQSDVTVPYRRALLYRSIFDAPQFAATRSGALAVANATSAAFAGAAIGSGVFASAGATSPAFVSSVIVTVFLSDAPRLPPLRRPRIAPYQTIFSPPLFVPITISGTFSTTGSTSVAFIESALFAGALSVSGSTSASFVGAAIGAGVLATSGATTATFAGASTAAATFATTGATNLAFVSNVIVTVFLAEAKVDGTALRRRRLSPYQTIFQPPLFVPLTRSGALSVSGSTAAAFTGASIASGVLAVADGTSPAFVGRATGAGVLSITGSTTAAFVGPNFQAGTLAVTGSTTVDAVGRTIVAAVLSTAGSTTIATAGLELKTLAGVLAAVGASEIAFSTTPIRKPSGRRTRVRPQVFSRPGQVFARRPANTSTGKRRPSWG